MNLAQETSPFDGNNVYCSSLRIYGLISMFVKYNIYILAVDLNTCAPRAHSEVWLSRGEPVPSFFAEKCELERGVHN